jgi:hypothetical protein
MEDPMEIQQRLQGAVDAMMKGISASRLRPLQRQTYLNMAKCFDHGDDQAAQRCVETESRGVQIAQQIIQNEIGQYTARVQRCMQECEDSTRDRMGDVDFNDPSVMEKTRGLMNKCASQCADKHIAMLKAMSQRIEKDIDAKTKGGR